MLRSLAVLLVVSGFASAQLAPPPPVPFASTPLPAFAQPAAYQAPIEPMVNPPADGGLFPVVPPPPPLWKGSFEAGANGATGNSEVFNTRIFWNADRKDGPDLFHTDMLYLLGTQNGVTNQNTMILNARKERALNGPWSLYGLTFVDYDELRDYKFIIGLYAGLGYTVRDTDDLFFKLRGGLGALYKTGGTLGDTWEPSINLGYDFRWRLSERSALLSVLDYYPSVDDFSDFLLRFKVAYEVTLDPDTGLFFRTGIFERYDSNPGPGKDKSDFNYFLTLGFNF
jgi:hypothetical protein